MEFQEEQKENNQTNETDKNFKEENNKYSNYENKKEQKTSKKYIVVSSLIFVAIIIGIVSIFVKPKESSISLSKNNNQNKDGIAVINLTGIITHQDKTSAIGIETPSVTAQLMEDFEYYMKNNKVKAIVLQVDSPGGSVVSCEEAFSYLKELKEKYNKPIIASFRGVAASGGYYLAMIADKIYANETTLTGSIGVISQFINVSELIQAIGIKNYTIKSGKNKDSFSPFRAPREDEIAYWQSMTDEFVAQFTNVVLTSRGDRIKGNYSELFDGRVFSGKSAQKYGLVDNIGTLRDAIKDAAEMVNLNSEEPNIITKPVNKSNILNYLLAKAPMINTSFKYPYEEIINGQYIGVPMYLYIPNYIGE